MPKHEGAVHLVCPGKYGCLLGEVDDEGLCRSTMPIAMSAKSVHATEQLVGECAVHLVCPGMSFLAACPGEEDDDVYDQHVMDEKKATSLSESRAGPLSRSR